MDHSTSSREQSTSARRADEVQPRPRSDKEATRRRTERDDSADEATSSATDQASRTASAKGDGGGAGTATSERESRQIPLAPSATASRDAREGEAAAGGATSAASEPGGEGSAGLTVMPSPSAGAPVWRSAEWREAREQALAAVRDGKVRDEHRDLVREYFDRTSD